METCEEPLAVIAFVFLSLSAAAQQINRNAPATTVITRVAVIDVIAGTILPDMSGRSASNRDRQCRKIVSRAVRWNYCPGQRADLVLLDANPLESIRNTERINGVVLRGRFLNRKTLDQILVQAARSAESN